MNDHTYRPASPEKLEREAKKWELLELTPVDWQEAPEAVPRVGASTSISLRMPTQMLAILKEFARRQGVGYQVLLKRWLDERIREERDQIAVQPIGTPQEPQVGVRPESFTPERQQDVTVGDSTSSESPLWDVRGWKRLTVHEDPQLVATREEFLAWLNEIPHPQRADLNARLRSELDHAHLSARLELFVHHYFRSNGWAVQIHPHR